MANESTKDFNAMLRDSKDMPSSPKAVKTSGTM